MYQAGRQHLQHHDSHFALGLSTVTLDNNARCSVRIAGFLTVLCCHNALRPPPPPSRSSHIVWATPAPHVPRRDMASITLDTHPHILDDLLTHAPYLSLLALRGASRSLRACVDTLLVTHIAVYQGDQWIAAVRNKSHFRIPRRNWLNVPALCDAVRVIDLCVTEDDEQQARVHNMQRDDAIHRLWHDPFGNNRDSPLPPPRCRCNQDLVSIPALNLHLAQRLLHVKLLRRWRGHRCRQLIAAERTVTFVPPEHETHVFLLGDDMTSPVHIVHLPYKEAPNFTHALFPQSDVSNIILRIAPPPTVMPVAEEEDTSDAVDSLLVPLTQLGPIADDEPTPFEGLVETLARQIANKVTIKLVGLEKWPHAPVSDQSIRQEVRQAIRTRLRWEGITEEKNAWDLVDCHVVVLSDDEYRDSIGEDMFALEAYCDPPGV